MSLIQSDVASGRKAVPQPFDATVITVPVEVTLPATAVAVGDIIEVCKIPAGVTLVGYRLTSPQIDSNATPTLAVSAGALTSDKTDLTTAYETGLTPGRTASGNVIRNANAAAYAASKTAERNFGLKVTTAAATYAASVTFLVELDLKS